MRRSIYLSVFIVVSAVAGFFYYSQTRQATAVVATHDLSVGTRIQDADVALRSINPMSVGGEVLRSPDQAVGQTVSSPILAGQFVDARQVAPVKHAALIGAGLQVPAGYRIIGLPISPAAAVGGVLKAGDLVDVVAIAGPSKATTLVDQASSPPVVMGRNVLVLGLRTDQGTKVDEADPGPNLGSGKAASVLLAIPESEETTYSAALADSTFVLALSTD